MLKEHGNVAWMGEHLSHVCVNYFKHFYLMAFSLKGSSGQMFSGLSAGTHTIDAVFTPNGVSQTIPLRLTFTIADAPTQITSKQ